MGLEDLLNKQSGSTEDDTPSDLSGVQSAQEETEPVDAVDPTRRELVEDMRTFETGATRDSAEGKLDFEGFLSPLVVQRFAEYMHKHRIQPDGEMRDSDNWQRGMPLESYMKSGWRHFMDWWSEHRGLESREGLEAALCGLLFNIQGYLHEHLKAEREDEWDPRDPLH